MILISNTPRRIRQRNEIAALQALHQFGPLSRADLARRLGLNRSSSGHIIAGLTETGLVREVAGGSLRAEQAHAGRPGIMLELVPDAVCFLGIEIGVEHISTVEIDLCTAIVSARSRPFDGASAGVEAAVDAAVQMLLTDLPAERLQRCEGLGVATPAQMNRHGLVRLAPLLGWENVPLADLVRQALPLPLPVVAENDANAFAIGATYGRSELRPGVTLFLVMESGVGGGIVVDGKLFRGANGLAGEVGHLRVSGLGEPVKGLEEILGLECVLAAYARLPHVHGADLGQLLNDVRDRVPGAVAIAEDWAKALALGLIQACRIIDADRVVLGGSVSALYPLMAARVAHHIATLQEPSFPVPDIVMNDNEEIGPAYGAACILHQRYLSAESQRLDEAAARL